MKVKISLTLFWQNFTGQLNHLLYVCMTLSKLFKSTVPQFYDL